MIWDHQDEVSRIRMGARLLRVRAERLRFDARDLEKKAEDLEREAEREEERADGVHRLCTAGSDPPADCCKRPAEPKEGTGRLLAWRDKVREGTIVVARTPAEAARMLGIPPSEIPFACRPVEPPEETKRAGIYHLIDGRWIPRYRTLRVGGPSE